LQEACRCRRAAAAGSGRSRVTPRFTARLDILPPAQRLLSPR